MFMLFRKTPNPGSRESLPGFTTREDATMCDAKNTIDGRCMDVRKDTCKWYLDGKCKKNEGDSNVKRQIQQDCDTIRQTHCPS